MKANRMRWFWGCALVAVAMLVSGASLDAQEGGERDGRRGGRPNARQMTEEQRAEFRERMQERMEQRREQQQERLQAALEMDDEEFAAVHPMIQQIRRYEFERRVATRPRRIGGADRPANRRGGDRPGPRVGPWTRIGPAARGDAEMSEQGEALQEAMEALQSAVDDESTSSEQLQSRLDAVREARQELAAAIESSQQELREVVVARQEAVLVMMGVLD